MKSLKSKPLDRRKIDIAVGLEWPKSDHKNRKFALAEPWPTIKDLLQTRRRTARHASGPRLAVRRLRARAGMSLKDGVIASIKAADVLVFDVTPMSLTTESLRCPPNVVFEIGVALGLRKPVILIGAGKDSFKALPSDLHGEFVAVYSRPDTAAGAAQSAHDNRNDARAIRAAIIALAAKVRPTKSARNAKATRP